MIAQLIYRGTRYTPSTSKQAPKPKKLIWRGIAHDGIVAPSPDRSSPLDMVYRGVAYTLLPNGTKVVRAAATQTPWLGGTAIAN